MRVVITEVFCKFCSSFGLCSSMQVYPCDVDVTPRLLLELINPGNKNCNTIGVLISPINLFAVKNNQSPPFGRLSLAQKEVSIILQEVNPVLIFHTNFSSFCVIK